MTAFVAFLQHALKAASNISLPAASTSALALALAGSGDFRHPLFCFPPIFRPLSRS
jgi:hypothetical protein